MGKQKQQAEVSQKKTKKELEEEEEEKKYKEELELEEIEEKEKEKQEKEKKKREKELKWTIEQEYFDVGLLEWDEFYIPFDKYRKMYENSDSKNIVETLRKDIEKIELFINYKANDIYEKWVSVKDQQKDTDENTLAVKNEIECLRAYYQYHLVLFEKFFKREMEDIYNNLLPKINNMIKNEGEKILNLEDSFKSTTKATNRITSLTTQQVEEYTENEEYLREREKYVLKQDILVQENKRYFTLQIGFVFLIPVLLNYSISIQSIQFENMHFYRAFFQLTLYTCCFSVCLWIWSKCKINYKVIFETPYQKENPVFWNSIFNIILMVGCLFTIFDSTFLDSPSVRQYCLILLFLQLYLGYKFIFTKALRVILDPFKFLVEFKSTFFTDQLCSVTLLLQDIDFFICYEYLQRSTDYCLDKKILHKGFLIAAIPLFWRLIQSFLMIFTTHKSFPFLQRPGFYNTIKFISNLYTVYCNYNRQFDSYYQQQWQYAIIVSSSLNYLWDVYQDWGLLRPQYFFLREKMLFKNQMYYVLAIIVNLCLRFSWIVANDISLKRMFYITYLNPFEQVALFAALEIVRRNIWNLFILEKLQIDLNNNYRVVQSLKEVTKNLENAQNSKDPDVKKILKNYNLLTKKVALQEVIEISNDLKQSYKQLSKKTRVKQE
ncbi:EXS family protein (macronuclear) [Tetrahymena thermophila SB210]|uniref:EXS family protein n=1 Tax=Tetrahymena thermophila (strain SB210) TaxID=312017 RepID=I7MHS1_TETTS|nr:EXS family protein [Tetrahymena thermophila SB210]EAR89364.1 EXS family protein [Tetrahymena thermophila SB210]|eukprot:XP_001009609.1 EXS family protein [Tetrahymena thermophila SB210]